MKKNITKLITTALFTISCLSVEGAFFMGIGELAGASDSSSSRAISSNGLYIVGQSTATDGIRAYRWSAETNTMTNLGSSGNNSHGYGVSTGCSWL